MSARKQTDDTLVLALAGGATVEAAVQQHGVSEATVRRKLADAGFRKRVVVSTASPSASYPTGVGGTPAGDGG